MRRKENRVIVAIIFCFFCLQGICLASEVTEEDVVKCNAIIFNSEIDSSTVNFAIRVKNECLDRNIIQTKMSIVSSGGEIDSAIASFNLLRLSKRPKNLKTVAIGRVESAAVILYLAGEKRLIASNAHIMLHPVFRLVSGSFTVDEMRLSLGILKEARDQEVGIIASRTKLSSQEIREMMRRQTILSAEEAVRFGFADSILQIK